MRKYRGSGGMSVTRNALPYYIGPGVTTGTVATAGNNANMITGTPVVAGGLVTGLYDVPITKFFTLNDVINQSDFTNLFDQYRIRKIVATFRMSTVAVASGATTGIPNTMSNPTLFWFKDEDDAGIFTNDAIRERMGVRSAQLFSGKSTRVVISSPRADMLTYNTSGTVTGAGIGRSKQWIDCTNNNIPHFALKFMLAGMDCRGTSSPPFQVTMELKYFLDLKQVR